MVALPSRHRHGWSPDTEQKMGFAILIAGLALFLAPHVFTAFRERREGVIASIGENAYKIVYSIISLAGLVSDLLWLFAVPRDRMDRRLVSAGLDAPRHGGAGVARDHLLCRDLQPGPHQDRAQASDAGRPQALGARASARERRPRLDHPVRRPPGLGGVRPHLAQAPHRSGRAADSGRRREKRRDRGGRRHRALSLARMVVPPLCDRRSRVHEIRPCRRRTRSSG